MSVIQKLSSLEQYWYIRREKRPTRLVTEIVQVVVNELRKGKDGKWNGSSDVKNRSNTIVLKIHHKKKHYSKAINRCNTKDVIKMEMKQKR